jgi:hypothetical protein
VFPKIGKGDLGVKRCDYDFIVDFFNLFIWEGFGEHYFPLGGRVRETLVSLKGVKPHKPNALGKSVFVAKGEKGFPN